MNGRLYDATLGRFISADPHVQFVEDLQNYNRYSYVMNNPLSYTDPSGYFLSGLFKKIGKFFKKFARPLLAIAAAFTLQFYLLPAIGVTGFASAVISGAVAGGITDGVRGAITGGITAGLFYGIGTAFQGKAIGFNKAGFGNLVAKSVAHGAVGGTSAVINGGEFKHGFFSAGLTQFASPGIDIAISGDGLESVAYRVTAAAVIGGTAAEVSGGKFENGAVTGAFSRLFNDELHRNKTRPNRNPEGKKRARRLAAKRFAEEHPVIDAALKGAESYVEGGVSYFRGNVRSARHFARSAGLYGSEEQIRAQLENKIFNEGVKFLAENPEHADEVGSLIVDQAKKDPSFVIGRTVAGSLTSFSLSRAGGIKGSTLGVGLTLNAINGDIRFQIETRLESFINDGVSPDSMDIFKEAVSDGVIGK